MFPNKVNRSRWQICLHSYNSLRFQYHFVIHFNNSRNSKTTAVLIGCFFIEQSSYTGSMRWVANKWRKGQNLFIHRSVQQMDIIMSFWQYGGRRRSYRCCESRNPAEHTLLHQDVVWCLGPHRVSPKPYHWSVFFGNLVLLPGTLRLSRFCGVDVLYSPFHLHNPQTDRPLGQIQNVLDLTTSHHSSCRLRTGSYRVFYWLHPCINLC